MPKQRVSKASSKGYDPLQDRQYLSPEMLAFFKKHLEDLRQRILSKENAISLNLVDTTTREADLIDQGATEDLHYGDLSLQEHEDILRQEIENALQRIKDGTYGYCETTGEPIGVKRLLLVPTARYTIKVQEKIEQENKR
jgi:DnaK suppressor protein